MIEVHSKPLSNNTPLNYSFCYWFRLCGENESSRMNCLIETGGLRACDLHCKTTPPTVCGSGHVMSTPKFAQLQLFLFAACCMFASSRIIFPSIFRRLLIDWWDDLLRPGPLELGINLQQRPTVCNRCIKRSNSSLHAHNYLGYFNFFCLILLSISNCYLRRKDPDSYRNHLQR